MQHLLDFAPLKVPWLIDFVEFYPVSAKFQPYNDRKKIPKTLEKEQLSKFYNISSKTQPMDHGLIRGVEYQYRKQVRIIYINPIDKIGTVVVSMLDALYPSANHGTSFENQSSPTASTCCSEWVYQDRLHTKRGERGHRHWRQHSPDNSKNTQKLAPHLLQMFTKIDDEFETCFLNLVGVSRLIFSLIWRRHHYRWRASKISTNTRH